MIIGIPRETAEDETRVALVPPAAKDLIEDGHEVCVAATAGEGSDWADADYREVGCDVLEDRETVFERADIIVQVRALGATPGDDVDPYTEGQVVVGQLGPYDLDEELELLADRGVTALALELIPRISRAQSMDALTSQASIGGYKSAIVAAEALPKMYPLQMTAAGTVQPSEVFVVGAGVAGLQAIATADRLGASVRGYDIRLEVKQEVESLGADFVELDLETEGSGDDEGYAREMDDEFLEQQRKELTRVVGESDVVITTAAVPGRPAPELVTTEMVEGMDPGSVIIDLSAATGGNCELTVPDETVEHDGVTIHGPTNLPATVSHHASQLYSNNIANFLENLYDDDTGEIDTDDEIVDSTMLTHAGEVQWTHPAERPDPDEASEDDQNDGSGEEAADVEVDDED
ncbi:Re/Si-specific NAD(P)(+) transhydrogenase subunit alpha [Natronomonas gomsonensis]|uniref:Re/Si-specific NAD(P)(+) transhydrogenase subunit alpha n=1 Tax=Natronomonas gomsonensis TaxID=1046043 RepID=UPI0020CA382E|nr:Re/Si-specific NAD(P)(+) transhydrogenase subunit alpha [Natronomonas gomsonensis]MCY4731603.1 Re/Si-specific NAD(P)(+) transhydrogenase subunit alpha [Natronomonas gomsonensis]